MTSHLVDFVRAELRKIPGDKRLGKDYSFILCPWHNEKTASGRVFHKDDSGSRVGRYKCYGCGKSAQWNELADRLGLERIDRDSERKSAQKIPPANYLVSDDEFLSVDKKSALEELKHFDIRNSTYQKYAGLVAGKWRGFKVDFLHDLGCSIVRKHFPEADYYKHYIYLPVDVKGKLRGYIKAQVKKPSKKGVPSYVNSSGHWTRKFGLFPYDQALDLMDRLGLHTIVLVEGPRDALRLLRMNIPAMCILGTQSWSAKKFKYLVLSGAERIILMMDGDKAGKHATKLIKTGLDVNGNVVAPPLKESFNVKVMKLWKCEVPDGHENYDPGNCPTEILLTVKEYLI